MSHNNKKISELPDATLPITTGVKFEAVQGGINVKVDADDMPGSGGGAVDSVNGQTGVVVLDAGDVGADPAGTAAALLTGTISDSDTTHAPTGNAVFDALALKLDSLETTRTVTVTHELDATDLASVNAGDQLRIVLNSASPITLEIPTNAVQAFPTNCVIAFHQYGAGQVTIAPDGGVTMRSPNNANKSFAQYSDFYLRKIGTNEWVLSGDITV